jgi:hypothetical protein
MKLAQSAIVGLVAVLCLIPAPPAARAVQADYGQITFENHANVSLECYVDGEYVGTVLKGLFITVEATEGSHRVEAVAVEDCDPPRRARGRVEVEAGGTTTWTVTED